MLTCENKGCENKFKQVRGGKKFCSKKCYNENRAKLAEKKRRMLNPPTQEICKLKTCSKEFMRIGKRIFCTNECRVEYQRIERIIERKAKKKPTMCLNRWCLNTFIKKNKTIYCSEECRVENNRRNKREYARNNKEAIEEKRIEKIDRAVRGKSGQKRH